MQFTAPAIALSLIALTAQSALASKYDFTVYNNTGYPIVKLYVSESSYETWGNDLTGSGNLPSGYNTGITFGNMSSYVCHYDFLAILSNGAVIENRGIDVCDTSWLQYH